MTQHPKNLSGTLEEMLAEIRTICENSSDILINRIIGDCKIER